MADPKCTITYRRYKCGCPAAATLANTRECKECQRTRKHCKLDERFNEIPELCEECQCHAKELWQDLELEGAHDDRGTTSKLSDDSHVERCELCRISHKNHTRRIAQQPPPPPVPFPRRVVLLARTSSIRAANRLSGIFNQRSTPFVPDRDVTSSVQLP